IIVKLAGDYFVIQTNSCGSDTSNHILVTIDTIPNISLEPISASVCVDSFARFTANATGSNLTYQWRKGNVNLIDTGNISGATTSTLTINPITVSDTASDYNVIVSGMCPQGDTSLDISLSLCIVDTFIPCHFPNTITPNEDATNDEFFITCNAEYPSAEVRIYDRWGAEVFRSFGHYDNKWDAHNQQGAKLPDGTYFYIYYFNDGSKRIHNGFIDVYR
ncbi:MAG TPA: gliding motility-associated C-terminal domain-containing protein, partial [Chitinophagales bacterium]